METQTQDLVPVNDADIAALVNAARELLPDDTVGLPLKYAKGHWYVKQGKDNEVEVGPTDPYVVDMLSYTEEWKRWQDKKPTHKISGRRVDGFINPPRHLLPEYENKDGTWPIGAKGPADPWQEGQRLTLRDLATGELVTWSSTSWGGRIAIGELLDQWAAECRQHPGLMPVVLLTSYERPTDYGPTPTPRLKIIDWEAFGPDALPPGDPTKTAATRRALEALQTLALPKPTASTKTQQRGDMDDEIPF
jgi:hypothetical protein